MASLTFLLGRALFVQLNSRKQDFGPVRILLVQNPPAIPALFLAWVYCRFWSQPCQLIIDWHNLAYSMISVGRLVRAAARWYEMRVFGPLADGHLAVTNALQDYLIQQNIVTTQNCRVLHDSPPAQFRLRTLTEQHQVLSKCNDIFRQVCPTAWFEGMNDNGENATTTLFTQQEVPPTAPNNRIRHRPTIQPRPGRPSMVVSSTSWTPDEDMGLLLDAWQLFDDFCKAKSSQDKDAGNVKVVCVITGKGPLKDYYQRRIDKMKLQHVVICTMWVRAK